MTTIEQGKEWVNFLIGEETYAIPVEEIKEIIPYTQPNPVPGSPADVEGILNVRGNVVTVISGSRILGEPDGQLTESAKIIMLDMPGEQLGVTINDVGEVMYFENDKIEHSSHSDADVIMGTVHQNNELVILLNMAEYYKESIRHD